MSDIAFAPRAVKKILANPKFQALTQHPSNRVAALSYYRRSYWTLNDGPIVEAGNGLTLHFPTREDLQDPRAPTYESVPLDEDTTILVGGLPDPHERQRIIDWTGKKFVPQTD